MTAPIDFRDWRIPFDDIADASDFFPPRPGVESRDADPIKRRENVSLVNDAPRKRPETVGGISSAGSAADPRVTVSYDANLLPGLTGQPLSFVVERPGELRIPPLRSRRDEAFDDTCRGKVGQPRTGIDDRKRGPAAFEGEPLQPAAFIVDERGARSTPGQDAPLVDDLSPRTVTAELEFETADYEHYEAVMEWGGP